MLFRFALILFVLFGALPSIAADTVSEKNVTLRQISGNVMCDNQSCMGATVTCMSDVTKGMAVDVDGNFSLECPENSGIEISHVGQETKTISAEELAKKGSTDLEIVLAESSTTVSEVVVNADNLKGQPCELSDPHAATAKKGLCSEYKDLCKDSTTYYVCIIETCQDGWVPNKQKNICEDERVLACTKVGGTWNPTKEKCENVKCSKRGQEWNDKLNKCFDAVKKKASDEEIAELEENAQAMRDKEQSTANKMLGGATMAATGIGGMMLAQGLAEKSADADAEMDMKAYLETFVCKYTDGKSIKGGTENVELPGGNELLPLYTEYVNLANDLKIRKEALGMRPGIEAEQILESATSGLYDDVALGKTGGAYASLARALQDPEGEDAKLWAEQKKKTKQMITAGAVVAGVGVVGGIVGNALINKNSAKESSADIRRKYAKMKGDVENVATDINTTPQSEKVTCQKYGLTGTFPDCDCGKNKVFSREAEKCVCNLTGAFDSTSCTCDAKATQSNNACQCTTQHYQEQDNKCVCTLSGKYVDSANCKCTGNARADKGKCLCDGNNEDKDGQCAPKASEQPASPKCNKKGMVDKEKCECLANATIAPDGVTCICDTHYQENNTKTACECALSGKFNPTTCKCVENAETKSDTFMCDCIDGFEDPENKGVCTQIAAEQPAEEQTSQTVVFSIDLNADVLFEPGKRDIKSDMKEKLQKIGKAISDNYNSDDADFGILIEGHADRTKFNSGDSKVLNQRLSEKRAAAVKTEVVKGISTDNQALVENIKVKGSGDTQCTPQKYKAANDERCRRVTITGSVKAANKSITNALSDVLGGLGEGISVQKIQQTITPGK